MTREPRAMKKPTALAAGLKAIASARPAAISPATAPPRPARRRAASAHSSAVKAPGTVLIGGHFPPQVRRALLLIQAEEQNERKNLKELLGEAINLLADKYGKPRPYSADGR